MRLQLRLLMCIAVLMVSLLKVWAVSEKLTTPPESLNGLRPGTLTVQDLDKKYGDPEVKDKGGLLHLYGGAENSDLYGWFMVENPDYDIPDLAVETAKDSDKVDLVMAIGYDGLKTEKGLTCFTSEKELTDTYGQPDFVFAVPMEGFTLREFYYVKQGISFDVAPVGEDGGRQVIAIYVTYPEYLTRAIELRKEYISEGTGRDITSTYAGGVSV